MDKATIVFEKLAISTRHINKALTKSKLQNTKNLWNVLDPKRQKYRNPTRLELKADSLIHKNNTNLRKRKAGRFDRTQDLELMNSIKTAEGLTKSQLQFSGVTAATQNKRLLPGNIATKAQKADITTIKLQNKAAVKASQPFLLKKTAKFIPKNLKAYKLKNSISKAKISDKKNTILLQKEKNSAAANRIEMAKNWAKRYK